MSGRGVFAVDRGIFDHPLLGGEPYTKVQAFMWLVGEAAWKPHRRSVGSAVVNLKRGQAACSVRFMASKWGWTIGRVQRFLDVLKTDTMIDTSIDTGVTVITICNYDTYQRVSLPTDTPSDTANDTQTIQQRYKVEDRENKEIDLLSASADLSAGDLKPEEPKATTRPAKTEPEGFTEFWGAYPRRKGDNPRKTALPAYRGAIARGAKHAAIMVGVRGYSAELTADGKIGTSFVAQAATWLNQDRFERFASRPEPPPDTGKPGEVGDYLDGLSDERWRDEVRYWKNTIGQWGLKSFTLPPDHPKTRVPQRILEEFGITPFVTPGMVNLLREYAA